MTVPVFEFGEGDWRAHYDVLMRSLEAESNLHVVGRAMVRTEVLRSLRGLEAAHDSGASPPPESVGSP